MKKIAILLGLMLVLGVVFISGCTTQNSTNMNTSGQNKSSGTPGYSTAQIVNIEPGNIASNIEPKTSNNP